jgi:hypothetical protein
MLNSVTPYPGWFTNHFSTSDAQAVFRGPKNPLSRGCSLWLACGGNVRSVIRWSLQNNTAAREQCDAWLSTIKRIRGLHVSNKMIQPLKKQLWIHVVCFWYLF